MSNEQHHDDDDGKCTMEDYEDIMISSGKPGFDGSRSGASIVFLSIMVENDSGSNEEKTGFYRIEKSRMKNGEA